MRTVGPDWALVQDDVGDEVVVLSAAVISIAGAGRSARTAVGAVAIRLSVRAALRGLARDRATVRIGLVDGSSTVGTIDRVGSDFVEVAVHAGDHARRNTEVSEVVIVASAAIAAIRRRL